MNFSIQFSWTALIHSTVYLTVQIIALLYDEKGIITKCAEYPKILFSQTHNGSDVQRQRI